MGSALDITGIFRHLRLWSEPEPVIAPPKPLPPLPMITYDKGLLGLPDDLIHEIFVLLDTDSLKSCSLAGKAISRSAKPFIHRSLFLTPRDRLSSWLPREGPSVPGHWDEFKGLPTLGERGLLQHTRHLSISLARNPLFHHDLRLHHPYLHTLTNLRSLKTRWLDTPSFLSKIEEGFGAFLGSLRSLELEHPRGDGKQILYFICKFSNLRDLRISGVQDHTHSMRNGGPHFDVETFPPLDGTLDLELFTGGYKGAMLLVEKLVTAPLKFRTLKLLGCIGPHPQLLIDACAPELKYMEYTWIARDAQCPPFDFKSQPNLRKLALRLVEHANAERVAAWLTETLSTITSEEFTELTIYIARVSHSFHTTSEDQVRGWNSVDDVLDRLSLYEDVTLVVRPQHCTMQDQFTGLIEKYFPLMWENGRVVVDEPPSTSLSVGLGLVGRFSGTTHVY